MGRSRKGERPEPGRWRGVRHGIAALVLISALSAAMHFLRRHVATNLTFTEGAPLVVLKDRPVWMSDALAEQIVSAARPAGNHSAFDHQMLVDISSLLRANPWVRKVKQIRRAYGEKPGDTIEIDCDFRAPVALVHWGEYYWLIDGEGAKLPEQFNSQQVARIIIGPDRKTNIRVIEGIKTAPPEPGRKWAGEDLTGGLEMAKLLFGVPYLNEIIKIDVSNAQGRRDPIEAHIVLVTKYGTEVRWGRELGAKDYFIEPSPAQKLANLKWVYDQHQRIDANYPWIDIRFDDIGFPDPQAVHASSGQ